MTQIKRLSKQALQTLTTASSLVEAPQYNFSERSSSIVHIGIGAFHKAHQATFTDDMMALTDGNYRITAVSLRSAKTRDLMREQDYLYTALEKSDQGSKARVIGAIEKVLVAPESPAAVINILSDSKIQVVTSTITEKGYCLLPGNSGLDFENSDIQHDLTNLNNPKSMIGFVVKACQLRQQNGQKGFTFISCDNLPDNSQIAGKAILDFAQRLDPKLAEWIKTHVSFCNSMVDRIVPAVTAQDTEDFTKEFGYLDNALVSSEPFRQWVIEDNFIGERPPWDKVGVLFVKDVSQYEKLKLRFLNGSHSALAYLGKITGHKFIHQAIANPTFKKLVASLMTDMTRSLSADMTFDFDSYGQVIVERFLNDQIQYETQQVATDGSQKLPQRILAPLSELAEQDHISIAMCIVIAGWIYYLSGHAENRAETHQISDPLAKQLQTIAQKDSFSCAEKVDAIMSIEGLFADSLKANNDVKELITNTLFSFHEKGIETTVESLL